MNNVQYSFKMMNWWTDPNRNRGPSRTSSCGLHIT